MKKKMLLIVLLSSMITMNIPLHAFAEPTDEMENQEISTEQETGEEDFSFEGGYLELPEDNNAPVIEEDSSELLTAEAIPAVYNPVANDYGYQLPAVRNQSPYGTCWAFSTSAITEMSYLMNTNKVLDTSELQLAYFTYHGSEDPLGGTQGDSVSYVATDVNYLERGGNLIFSTQALLNWRGATDEATVPYDSAESTLLNGLDSSYEYDSDKVHVQDVYYINIKQNRDAVKKAIMTYGAVGASYYHNTNYYQAANNSYYTGIEQGTNHAISIVGWNDDFPASNFKTQPAQNGAWLVRNSWGYNDMSLGGYFWMSYEETTLAETAYAVKAEETSNYDHNYQYDGAIYTYPISHANDLCAANVFTCKGDYEMLKAVSFNLPNNAQVDYTIKIYKNPTDEIDPTTGTLIEEATTSGKTEFAGTYTVPLKNEVFLRKGDTFTVLVELSKQGETLSIGAEYTRLLWDSVQSTASSDAKQSYYNYEGLWIDFGEYNNRNIRIKAFTTDTDAPVYTVTLDANGGTVSPSNVNVVEGGKYGELPTPKKSGMTFVGWYTKASGGTKVTKDSNIITSGDHTLYAHYSGWTKGSDGELRLYDKNGNMVKNKFAFDGNYTYYLQADGSPMKDRLTYHPDGEHIIYLDENGHEVFNAFQYCPSVGYTCYFDSQGYIYKDQITFVGDKVYYLNGDGKMENTGWFQFANGRDYGFANTDGTLHTEGFSYDPWGRVVFYHWNGMVARGLITDGVYYYSMDETDGHYLGSFQVN